MINIDNTPLPSKQIKDIRGRRFGRLLVLSYAGKARNNATLWNCLCDCGKQVTARGCNLTSGGSRSCGCLSRETTSIVRSTHRMRNTVEYRTWGHIKSRCTNPNVTEWGNYGGRGITICDRWLNSFENFYADMGDRPSPQHSIERIDNDGPYSPENCKWANYFEQANNKRNNHLVTYQGVTKTLPEWAIELDIPYSTLKRRIQRGMPPEIAFTKKVRPIKYNLLTCGNETMTVSEWAKRLGASGQVITHRLYQGWSVEKAVTTPVAHKRHSL